MAGIYDRELRYFIDERLKEDLREAQELALSVDFDNTTGGLSNPNRILREVWAKRQLLMDCIVAHSYNSEDPWYSCAQAVKPEGDRETPEDWREGSGCADPTRAGGPCDCGSGQVSLRVMLSLAEMWEDHDVYRREWKR